MQQVFKCDYCKFMGTEQEVREHEVKCFDNYDRKSCFTCVHKIISGINYKCDCGKEIPEGQIFEFCDKYERKEKPEPLFDFRSMWR
jgi:hypothetical protein